MKPMVFTKDNVIATMEGRKIMSRRIINPQPEYEKSQDMYWWKGDWDTRGGPRAGVCTHGSPGNGEATWTLEEMAEHGKYQVGDEVYVAEGYQVNYKLKGVRQLSGIYLADGEQFICEITEKEYKLWSNRKFPYRPTPGRFMYKSLARTFMTITEVRVERVGDISWEDVEKEGLQVLGNHARRQMFFGMLWDKIHGFGAFSRNDWVWVYKWVKE